MENFKLNEQIAFLRKARGVTQEELAQTLGVTNQAVSKWESAQCCPDIQLLPGIAAYFGVSVDELIGYRGADTSNNLFLQLRTVIDGMPAGEDSKFALELAYRLHAILFSKKMMSGGNPGWNSDDAIDHAGAAEWGMSCLSQQGITTRMRYESVFFSSNKSLHLDSHVITALSAHLRRLSDARALRTLTALYTLTVGDERYYAPASEVAEAAGLPEHVVCDCLQNVLAEYPDVNYDGEQPRYRIRGRYMHIVPLVALLSDE